MDQLVVDLGEAPVPPGAPAVLIGMQGGSHIPCEQVASEAGAIGYEITCSLSRRVRRVYTRSRG